VLLTGGDDINPDLYDKNLRGRPQSRSA